jgi:hypothetical protein
MIDQGFFRPGTSQHMPVRRRMVRKDSLKSKTDVHGRLLHQLLLIGRSVGGVSVTDLESIGKGPHLFVEFGRDL